MKILLAPAAPDGCTAHEVLDAHERERALHGADPVILTQCGLCDFSLGVRQPDDPPGGGVLVCPGCGSLNRAPGGEG